NSRMRVCAFRAQSGVGSLDTCYYFSYLTYFRKIDDREFVFVQLLQARLVACSLLCSQRLAVGGAAMEFPPSAIAVFIHRVFSPAKDDARATRGEAGPIHLTYKNSLQLSNAQQTLLTPGPRAPATAPRLSAPP